MTKSLFDDGEELTTTQDEIAAADDRTLRLAAPPLTEERLAALVRYQEAFLAEAEGRLRPGAERGEALSTAHQKGLEASGLPNVEVERGAALLRAFCGRRWTLQRIEARYAQLQGDPGPAAEERRMKVEEELVRLRSTEDLERRYGADTLALLRRAERQLVPLHVRLVRVLGQG